jgi:hypothetical protein
LEADVATKLTEIGKLESQLAQIHKKLKYVESRTEIISNASVRLANGIKLLARASSDPRDLK